MMMETESYTETKSPVTAPAEANLYVNNIGVMSESQLKGLFQQYGTIVRHRVMKDPSSGLPMGFGFVQFSAEEEAKKAIEALNGYVVAGKPMDVSVARKSEHKTSKGDNTTGTANAVRKNNVYCANFPLAWTKTEVEGMFAPYGSILESTLLTDQAGKSRGVAFVRFSNYGDAVTAINNLNGSVPPNATEPLVVKFARDPSAKVTRVDPVAQMASVGYGAVRHQGMRIDPYSRGVFPPNAYGASPYQAMVAPTNANQSYVAPQPTYAAPPPQFSVTNRSSQVDPACALFLFHLPPLTNEQDLYQLFSMYGTVHSVTIMRDPMSGASKGYGFVNMSSASEASAAVQYLNGYQIGDKYMKVQFKKSNSKQSDSNSSPMQQYNY